MRVATSKLYVGAFRKWRRRVGYGGYMELWLEDDTFERDGLRLRRNGRFFVLYNWF